MSLVRPSPARAAAPADAAGWVPDFDHLYDAYFAFAWRMLWRFGVPRAAVPDAVQDVFVIVHRRLGDLDGQHVVRSWIYGIIVRVAREYRRKHARRAEELALAAEELVDPHAPNAHEQLEQARDLALLEELLSTLDEAKREVLVLVELEQMSVPEVAELLDANVNTIYTRLRAARAQFERAHARYRVVSGSER